MENKFGTGAIIDTQDPRDYRFTDFIGKSAQFDWNKGFDIEAFLGFKIPVKNQYQSSSCGGQAVSYYGGVLEHVASKTFENRSARWVYAQAFAPGGGSNMRPLMKVVTDQGWAEEVSVPSIKDNDAPEEFMTQLNDVTQDVRDAAMSAEAKSYAIVNSNIDEIALAIQNNYGCILGISGENNGTWFTAFPQVPNTPSWGHWVYVGKAKIINGKKYIGILNSWGTEVGEQGWQWLGEEWFTTKVVYPNQNAITAVWYGWTIIFDNESLRNSVRLSIIAKLKKIIELLTLLKK